MVRKEEFECGRSRVLHNFELPSLKWGCRKVMRCMKVDNGDVPAKGHRSFIHRKVSFKLSPAEKLGFGKRLGEVEFDIPASTVGECETMKPWNLRTRRARLEPEVCEIAKLKVKGKESPAWCLRGGGEKRKRERVKFSVSLSKDEIEEDFMVITGCRVPRRPKKRPKILQKQLDMLFPGLWLTEVNADLYKVPDLPETGKVIC